MSKHTPGPWDITIGNDITGYPFFYANGMSRSIGSEELAANAKLIAAPPELLEALKMAEGYVVGLKNQEMIAAAVAKTTVR